MGARSRSVTGSRRGPSRGVSARPNSSWSFTEADTVPLRVIDQHGWTIAYDAFTSADGFSLPTRLTATSGNVRLRLFVSDWTELEAGSE